MCQHHARVRETMVYRKTHDHIKECGVANSDTLSEGKEHGSRKIYYRKIQTGLDGIHIEG